MDGLTDGQGDSYIPPQTLFVGGIIRELAIQTSIIAFITRPAPLTAYWSFMKLDTVVVHYLQMCMKEYGCCSKFKRGDN
jgi:hypothetical protein